MLLRCQSSRLFLENTQTGCAVVKTRRAALSTTCHEHTFNHDTMLLQVHCVVKETGQLFQIADLFVSATSWFFFLFLLQHNHFNVMEVQQHPFVFKKHFISK